jgi:membrane protease YdiL (CAAX protease family)
MSNSISATISHLKEFLKNPVDEAQVTPSKTSKFKIFLTVLVIDILVSSLVILLVSVLQYLKLINEEDNLITSFIGMYPLWAVILLAVFFIPFFEEIIFRLHLRFRQFYLLQIFLYFMKHFHKNNLDIRNNALSLWKKNYGKVFYFTAIVFGLIHLSNYNITIWVLIFSPVLVFAQFAFGIFAGYLRVKYGFFYGYALHFMHNGILLALPLMLMAGETEVLNIKNKDYNITIHENLQHINNSSITVSLALDTLTIDNFELKKIIPELLEKDEQLFEFGNDINLNKILKVKYYSNLKDRNSNRDIILNILKKQYKFDLETFFKNKEIWDLQVFDSVKSNKFISPLNYRTKSSISESNGKIDIENVKLIGIAGFLSNHFKTYIISSDSTNSSFKMTFKLTDFAAFRKTASEQFGLQFVKSSKETEVTKIKFHK